MSETYTMNEAPANPEAFNADEQNSLEVAESLEAGDEPLLAGKFKDSQSLEKAYLELQQKLGEQRYDTQESQEQEEPVEEETAPEVESDDQTLSEEQAVQLMDQVGGEKAYKAMLDWAGDNFSKEEIGMYDSVMESGNAEAIFFAMQALQSRYNDSVGSDGEMLTGRTSRSDDDSFKSQAELVEAMNDVRYTRDPAYRRDVMRRLENSNVQF